MRFLLTGILVALLFCFCKNTNPNKEFDAYLEKEILNRISILDSPTKAMDTLQINAEKINKEINDIILLSKDIENLQVSVRRANAYFKKGADRYLIDSGAFFPVTSGMHVNEIATVVKQNELTLLNQLIFKTSHPEILPTAAQ